MNIEDKIRELAPWHFDVEVGPNFWVHDVEGVRDKRSFYNPIDHWKRIVEHTGFEGGSVLDCGCNNGAMGFLALESGAERYVGVDAHRHWIEQAFWLRGVRGVEYPKMRFDCEHIGTFAYRCASEFDLILFNGIFYHLSNPVSVLTKVTKLLAPGGWLCLNTATWDKKDEGKLIVQLEGTNDMSGVDGLSMYPDGPEVVERILKWLGYEDIKIIFWSDQCGDNKPRLELVARKM